MDKFFFTCFFTSMFCSIESGIIYAIITNKSKNFLYYMNKFFIKIDENKNQSKEDIDKKIKELKNEIDNWDIDNKESVGVYKTIDFNDPYLKLNSLEKNIDSIIVHYIIVIDSIIKIITPIIFFSIISEIFSHQH